MIGPDGGLVLNVKRDRRNKNRKKLFMQEFFYYACTNSYM